VSLSGQLNNLAALDRYAALSSDCQTSHLARSCSRKSSVAVLEVANFEGPCSP
jgi:hypothetical protein